MSGERLRGFERRDLIKSAAALAVFAGLSRFPAMGQIAGAYPFKLGVASGDPWPDGFVIWTRLATQPLAPAGGMPMRAVPVSWEIAEDDSFKRIVRSGDTLARPELGHSVHVELNGLKPGHRYWYRFQAAGDVSTVGTARTAPAAGAKLDRLRIAVAGCQHYEAGLFTAYRHISQIPDLDAVFHYGDYIYEGGGRPLADDRVREHVGSEIYTIDDYRRRHAQYKTDSDLQAAHAAAPFLSSWDDHEIDNNWAGREDQDGTPPELFALRKAMAMQAWYENMPVRQAQFPAGASLRLHRRIDYGDLLRIHVLDSRQYRTGQICNPEDTNNCIPISAENTILGAEQERWLHEGIGHKGRWNLLAQQVMVMPFLYSKERAAGRANTDSWSGYPGTRDRLVSAITEQRLSNVVIATGDVHRHHVGAVPQRAEAFDGPAVATEFVCTSISSGGDGSAKLARAWRDVPADNPHCKLISNQRGYQLFDIGRERWDTHVRVVDKVTTPGGAVSTLKTFSVDPRRPGLL
ncbi:MAG: alkaline phosphatase [Sphingomonadales bacterium]|nr:MAG: alkaline phosphatase [Sphingomonadales bacterium]